MDFYEYNAEVYSDPELPVYFSINTLTGSQEDWDLHWHEATEFLYCIEGSGVAVSVLQTRHKVLHLWYHTPSIYGTLDFDGIVRLIP